MRGAALGSIPSSHLVFVGYGNTRSQARYPYLTNPAGNGRSSVGGKEQESPETASDIPSSLHQDSSTEDAPTIVVDGIEYLGVLEIPDIGLTLPVISQWSYPHLKLAPCRYSGLPQESGFVLAGHNYRAHFGPIDRLTPGARVQFTDAEDSVYLYQVEKTELLSPTAVEEMTAEEWDLTLFTCDFSGKARIAVRCQKDPTNG